MADRLCLYICTTVCLSFIFPSLLQNQSVASSNYDLLYAIKGTKWLVLVQYSLCKNSIVLYSINHVTHVQYIYPAQMHHGLQQNINKCYCKHSNCFYHLHKIEYDEFMEHFLLRCPTIITTKRTIFTK